MRSRKWEFMSPFVLICLLSFMLMNYLYIMDLNIQPCILILFCISIWRGSLLEILFIKI